MKIDGQHGFNTWVNYQSLPIGSHLDRSEAPPLPTAPRIEIPLDVPETEVTFEFQFKTNNINGGLFSVQTGENSDRNIYMQGGRIFARLWEGGQQRIQAEINVADGQWHHIAYVIGQSVEGHHLYIDGREVSFGFAFRSDYVGDNLLIIGYSPAPFGGFFTGQIREFRAWGRTFNLLEVRELLTQKIAGDEADLLSYLPLNDSAVDLRGNLVNVLGSTSINNGITISPPHLNGNDPLGVERYLTRLILHAAKVEQVLNPQTRKFFWEVENNKLRCGVKFKAKLNRIQLI